MTQNPLHNITSKNHHGKPSYCTANSLVLEALLEHTQDNILIEGTANQINQFGGYTGLTPSAFRDYVFSIADKVHHDRRKIILGGDHMGPLVWANLPEHEAMTRAKELVRLCVLAGFKKIHLDTSMKLADDPEHERLSGEVIAERGAVLLSECEAAYQELLRDNPDEMRPVYVIGSEVPIPGGTQSDDEGLRITSAQDFADTITTYRRKFSEYGISERWHDVIGVVVQPGVEFGDKDIHEYDREAAKELSSALGEYSGVVFEGHSTDYQTREKLREMVEDGVKILKVGPALTFALREGLFALSMIERELFGEGERANFIDVLECAMLDNPANWIKHYHGSELDKHIARKYSYSDRCRYYFALPEVREAIAKLFANIDNADIPAGLLRQYMPVQYGKIRAGMLGMSAAELVKDYVKACADDYDYAVRGD